MELIDNINRLLGDDLKQTLKPGARLPEVCADDSEAFKAGYRNICDIGKERIRRAGALIRSDSNHVDLGFGVLKIESPNMADIFYTPDAVNEGALEGFVRELATHQALRAVFRDAGFADSAAKINVEQIFKLLSPGTEVKCL